MTANEAYTKIKDDHRGKVLVECLEFDDFFGFFFADYKGQLVGGAYTTVNKKDGSISVYNPIDNFALLDTAKSVDVNTIHTE